MKFLIALSLILQLNLCFAITLDDAIKKEKTEGALAALPYYNNLIEQNNPEAMFLVAKIYSEGREVQQSLSKTHELLLKADKLGHDKSTYFLGKLHLSKSSPFYNLKKAYNYFVKSANNGYAPSQNMVGQFLVNGIVVEKDYKMAVLYFERAAKQNLIDAQCNLSFMYASGKGVFPNFGRANQFAKKGYELGNKRCIKVWEDYNLEKYPEDKGFKFNFYTKP